MSIIDAVNRWYAAWNAHDTAAIADAMSPAGTYIDPTLDSPIDNETTAEYAVSHVFEMYPDGGFKQSAQQGRRVLEMVSSSRGSVEGGC